jgi:hypothetical protein
MGPKDIILIDGLITPPISKLRGSIRAYHNQGYVCLMRLNNRR